MNVVSKSRVQVTWVNKTAFPLGTSWRDMHQAGEAEYPGTETRICTPGEIIAGEEVPTSFNGKFLCEEFDRAHVEVTAEEQEAFETKFRAETPVEGDKYGEWFTKLGEARYHYFRGKFFYENPRYSNSRIKFSFEVVSCLDEDEEAA